jgi:uncharacterized protein
LRVVLDTNVLVSAFLKPRSNPARILRLVLQGDVEIAVNESILQEYLRVLERPKFAIEMDDVRFILDTIRATGFPSPALAKTLHLPHRADEILLEAALAARADALVTGNARHFPSEDCHGQRVLTSQAFLSFLNG